MNLRKNFRRLRPLGSRARCDGLRFSIPSNLAEGAARAGAKEFAQFLKVAKGGGVTKYGAPIGVATKDIAPGDSMHIHNVTSDYIPTYTLDEGHQFFKEH